ncbi:MAG: hypothetical protein E6J82_00440 [Deltaproteobacteria bacterium]|nr:MAG: hypothetical protein E6J82_00440 [Deltaproteobacteria bacterium]
MKRIAVLLVCAAACKSAPPPAPATAAPKEDGRAARNTVVSAPDRSAADKDLDPGRKPAEMLDFLDVRPGMKVEDLGAGGGYTTELIARSVGPSGAVYMQNDPRWLSFLKDALAERFTHPAMKDVVRAEIPFDDPVPPEAKNLAVARPRGARGSAGIRPGQLRCDRPADAARLRGQDGGGR